MTTTLEKMARAMQASPAWPAVYGAGTAEALVRSALMAIRVPGDDLMRTGLDAMNVDPYDPGVPWEEDAGRAFTAMIDLILNEGEGK